MQHEIIDLKHEKVGQMDLPENIFQAEERRPLLWLQVNAQRASARAGTHSTKTRGEVRGGGIKPFKQKGTGRARQGSIRAPNHVGGGVVFGPKPRDYSYRLPRTARRAAMSSALSVRVTGNDFFILDAYPCAAPSTKFADAFIEKFGAGKTLVVDVQNDKVKRSVRNLPNANYIDASMLTVFDILRHKRLVMTRSAVDALVTRLSLERGSSRKADVAGQAA